MSRFFLRDLTLQAGELRGTLRLDRALCLCGFFSRFLHTGFLLSPALLRLPALFFAALFFCLLDLPSSFSLFLLSSLLRLLLPSSFFFCSPAFRRLFVRYLGGILSNMRSGR